jgi:hypothetical protein
MLRIFNPFISVEQDMPLCNLGHLFNAYTARLSPLEIEAVPQETLREYHRLMVPAQKLNKADRAKARAIKAAQERLYVLALLDNSLHDMHNCVVAACNTLGDLFNLYGGDLREFAIQQRLKQVAEHIPGTDEEMQQDPELYAEFIDDWEPTDPADPDGPWKVKYKDDKESLAPYTIMAQLEQFFAPLHEQVSIDTIGSATPEDFAYFTEAVRTYSEAHKTSHIYDLTVYRPNPTSGEMEAQDYAQRIENEVNDDLKDKRVASYFNQILRRMHFVSGLAAMLTDSASCRELLDELLSIRDCTDLHEPASIA